MFPRVSQSDPQQEKMYNAFLSDAGELALLSPIMPRVNLNPGKLIFTVWELKTPSYRVLFVFTW